MADVPDRLKEIMDWGVAFDRNDSGELDLGREGGHTAKRIVHYKDITGLHIEKVLLKEVEKMPNIDLLSHHFAIDLITEHHFKYKIVQPEPGITCYGVYVMDQKTCRIEKYVSRITLLATGSGPTGGCCRWSSRSANGGGCGDVLAVLAQDKFGPEGRARDPALGRVAFCRSVQGRRVPLPRQRGCVPGGSPGRRGVQSWPHNVAIG